MYVCIEFKSLKQNDDHAGFVKEFIKFFEFYFGFASESNTEMQLIFQGNIVASSCAIGERVKNRKWEKC